MDPPSFFSKEKITVILAFDKYLEVGSLNI